MLLEQYEHHGKKVFVRSDLKGKHRENCLCHLCANFFPGKEENCPKAQKLYELCVAENLVTPVWECPDFAALLARRINDTFIVL